MFGNIIASTANRGFYLKVKNVEYSGSFRDDFVLTAMYCIDEDGLYKFQDILCCVYKGEQSHSGSKFIPFLSEEQFVVHKLKGSNTKEVHLRIDCPLYEFYRTINLGHSVFKAKYKVTGISKWVDKEFENTICDD